MSDIDACSNPDSLNTSNAASTIACLFSSVFLLIDGLPFALRDNRDASRKVADATGHQFSIVAILPKLNQTV
ncbi:MAG TPA: hypothetical protein VJU59_15510 [Paraburkholderia sp.]|uniref:hypothetical protein n=1 Tax=Paraburkholderia sp. TaxID=1926495 RepID=UPI002B476B0B|nr:hypothetical protein [Paraburkholderia sp.]HKR41060.1 hypothetical protein [Paraburkholderia sp.]